MEIGDAEGGVTTVPAHDYISTLIYQATSQNVNSVIIDGDFVMEDGKLRTKDIGWLIDEAQDRASAVVSRAKIEVSSPWLVI